MPFRSALAEGKVQLTQEQRRLLEAATARQNDMLLITEASVIDAPDGPRIVYVNDAFERVTGYSREEVIGATPRILQGPRTQRSQLDRIRHALERAEHIRVEVINYTKSGAECWLEIDITPVHDDSGKLTHFVAIQREITQRREAEEARRISEERFELLSRATSDLIWDWDLSTGAIWWNDGLRNHFGYDPDDIGAGPDFWFQRIHEDDRDRVRRDFDQILAGNGNHYRDHYRFLKADGSIAQVRDQGFVIRDAEGRPRRIVGSTVDVTEAHALAENAAQAQKLAALGQLTGGIAHDFNNLLTVIMGNAEALVESPAGSEHHRALAEMIMSAGQRASELTSRLLSFARRQTLQSKVTNLNRTVSGMMPLIRRSISEEVELSTSLSADIWQALLDPGQFEVALLNLVINARDAIADGGRITIETRNVELGHAEDGDGIVAGEHVMVCVSDTGWGMTPEILERAFEPFFTTKREGRGSGLGLSMVYGFVKQSGGHIVIDTEVGSGTAVKLYFPRVVGIEQDIRVPVPEKLPSGSERILVVEDDPLVLRFVSGQLAALGYDVCEAISPAEAEILLDEQAPFDLLFTDVVMPGSDGAALAIRAKKMQPWIKVLYTSGHTEGSIVHKGWLKRELRLLKKPYSRRTLAENIREAIESSDD